MKNFFRIITCMIVSICFFSSCHNKSLCPSCDQESGIEIKFDWKNIEKIPSGMTVLFYSPNGNLVYTFKNVSPNGERIRIESGNYQVACYNNDTEYGQWSGFDKIDSLNVTTREGELDEDHTRAANTPETGVLNVMPDYLCGDVIKNKIILPDDPTIQIVLLTPKPLIDIYTYQISEIENAQYITKIRATLSSLSDRYYLANPDFQKAATTVPFNGNIAEDNKAMIIGQMYNLGYFRNTSARNILTLYLWTPGGNLKATFDVTDQIRTAPNPHRVNIIIKTKITVPPPIEGDDGLNPSVDEWQDIYYDVIM
ncbi:MAG: DUF5119 domain-containing protein [Bacteroidales bacterium]